MSWSRGRHARPRPESAGAGRDTSSSRAPRATRCTPGGAPHARCRSQAQTRRLAASCWCQAGRSTGRPPRQATDQAPASRHGFGIHRAPQSASRSRSTGRSHQVTQAQPPSRAVMSCCASSSRAAASRRARLCPAPRTARRRRRSRSRHGPRQSGRTSYREARALAFRCVRTSRARSRDVSADADLVAVGIAEDAFPDAVVLLDVDRVKPSLGDPGYLCDGVVDPDHAHRPAGALVVLDHVHVTGPRRAARPPQRRWGGRLLAVQQTFAPVHRTRESLTGIPANTPTATVASLREPTCRGPGALPLGVDRSVARNHRRLSPMVAFRPNSLCDGGPHRTECGGPPTDLAAYRNDRGGSGESGRRHRRRNDARRLARLEPSGLPRVCP